jgi:hypothetical protein
VSLFAAGRPSHVVVTTASSLPLVVNHSKDGELEVFSQEKRRILEFSLEQDAGFCDTPLRFSLRQAWFDREYCSVVCRFCL